jgi:hypothetical protein
MPSKNSDMVRIRSQDGDTNRIAMHFPCSYRKNNPRKYDLYSYCTCALSKFSSVARVTRCLRTVSLFVQFLLSRRPQPHSTLAIAGRTTGRQDEVSGWHRPHSYLSRSKEKAAHKANKDKERTEAKGSSIGKGRRRKLGKSIPTSQLRDGFSIV